MDKSSIIETKNGLFLFFYEHEEWEDFDIITEKLIKCFKAVSISRIDGPGTRMWEFLINDVQLRLYHEEFGNFIKASDEKQRKIIERISKEWNTFV